MRKRKYGNAKITVDGIQFDSKREAARYQELKLLEHECSYIADFCYIRNGETVVEDAKGYRTEVYRIKKKLMLERYGIQIREV